MLEGLPGGRDGEIHVGFIRLCYVGQHIACPWVPRLKSLAWKRNSTKKTYHIDSFSLVCSQSHQHDYPPYVAILSHANKYG